MGVYVSQHTYDCINGTLVPVIASFDTAGHVAPLYIRINGVRCRIANYSIRNHWSNSIEFKCEIEDAGYVKPVILKYFKAEDVWCMV